MEVKQDEHFSQDNTNPIMKPDVNEPGDQEVEDKKPHNNIIPKPAPPGDPAREAHKQCDQNKLKLDTPVGSKKQLSNSMQTTPDRPGHLEEEEVAVLHEEGAHLVDTTEIGPRSVAGYLPKNPCSPRLHQDYPDFTLQLSTGAFSQVVQPLFNY